MSMLELALKTHLESKTTITDIVGTRLAMGDIDPDTSGRPDLLFRMINLDNAETLDGNGEDLQFPLFQFQARSAKVSETVTLAALIRRALRELATGATISTSLGDVVIAQLLIVGVEDDQTEFEGNGKARIVHSRSIVVQVGHRYSVAAVS